MIGFRLIVGRLEDPTMVVSKINGRDGQSDSSPRVNLGHRGAAKDIHERICKSFVTRLEILRSPKKIRDQSEAEAARQLVWKDGASLPAVEFHDSQ